MQHPISGRDSKLRNTLKRFPCHVLLLLTALLTAQLTLLMTASERALVLTPTPVITEATLTDAYSSSHALVIGCSAYQHLTPLPGVRDDVAAISQALTRHGFSVQTVLNPTRTTLTETIHTFVTGPGDDSNARLVIYFAGHGLTLYDRDGTAPRGYLAPIDAATPQTDTTAFKQSAFYLRDLLTRTEQARSKHILVALDSCFSGALFQIRSATPPNTSAATPLWQEPARLFLTAGSADEAVPDESIFRRAFIAGLNGAADRNGDGAVWGVELSVYINEQVTAAAALSGLPQTPQWRLMPAAGGGKTGDILLTTTHKKEALVAPPATEKKQAIAPPSTSSPEALLAHYQQKIQRRDKLSNQAQQRVAADRHILAQAWLLSQRLPDDEKRSFWRDMQNSLAEHPEADGRYQLREWLACQLHGTPPWAPAWADAGGEDSYGRWITRTLPGGWIQGFRWLPMQGFPEGARYVWVADTELAQLPWQAVMPKNPSRFAHADNPVDSISHLEAQAFLDHITAELRHSISTSPPELAPTAVLPLVGSFENLDPTQSNQSTENLASSTVAVWATSRNALGLYGTDGNVCEWHDDIISLALSDEIPQATWYGRSWQHRATTAVHGADAIGAHAANRGMRIVITSAENAQHMLSQVASDK